MSVHVLLLCDNRMKIWLLLLHTRLALNHCCGDEAPTRAHFMLHRANTNISAEPVQDVAWMTPTHLITIPLAVTHCSPRFEPGNLQCKKIVVRNKTELSFGFHIVFDSDRLPAEIERSSSPLTTHTTSRTWPSSLCMVGTSRCAASHRLSVCQFFPTRAVECLSQTAIEGW